MKRRVEFICMAIVLTGCGLQYPGPADGSSERIEPRYQHVSDSAPESLRPFYDPGLTQALNR